MANANPILSVNYKFLDHKAAWLGLLAITLVGLAIVIAPVWIIQPFKPQTARGVEVSYALRRWSPLLTLIASSVGLVLTLWLWRSLRAWWRKAALVVILVPLLAATWFARQNHFEWMFNPLANASYAKTSEAHFVNDSDVVMATIGMG